MILNLDDINYTILKYYWGPKYKTKYIDKCESIEDFMNHPKFNWVFYSFSKFIIKARILEIESCFAPIDHYYSYRSVCELINWPEMEEVIRRHSDYKFWYEEETGKRI